MKKLLIASLLLVSACAQKSVDPRWVNGVDPVFQPYLDQYVAAKGSSLSTDIPIGFADLSELGNVAGICTRWSNGLRQIEIDKEYWDNPWTSNQEKIALLFHELGHCDLNRGHDTTLLSNGWPVSLMYPYVVAYYPSVESYYLYELFNPVSPSMMVEEHSHNCVYDIKVESSK